MSIITKTAALWILAIAVTASLAGHACRAEDSPSAEDEGKQFDQEEKDALAAAGKDTLLYTNQMGKLKLFTKEEIEASGDTKVLGKFENNAGVYLVKAMSPEIENALKKYDGKIITVSAKIRNGGKYIYIKKFISGAGESDYKPRRGGL